MLREHPRPTPFRSGLALGIAAIVVVALFPLASAVSGFLAGVGNPFRSERVERASVPVLTELTDLEELHAATAALQVVVEIEDDTRFAPDVVSGRHTTYLAVGSVDALVDLSAATIEPAATGDGVVVTLPAPVLDAPALDPEQSRVLDRDRGVLDRVADALGEPADDGDLQVLAAGELARAAGESDLLQRARTNARATVEELLAGAGVDDVTVTFAPVPEPGAVA